MLYDNAQLARVYLHAYQITVPIPLPMKRGRKNAIAHKAQRIIAVQ